MPFTCSQMGDCHAPFVHNAPMQNATYRMTAFLDGPDSPDISNPIHSTDVAKEYGFKAALVGGVSVYGWCARTIMAAIGDDWLDTGWADINFRRPVFPGDELTISVTPGNEFGELQVVNGEGDVCIRGTVGLGEAPFLDKLHAPVATDPVPPADPMPYLTMETAPVGRDLRPMQVPYTLEDAANYAHEKQRDEAAPWIGEGARIHPGWLAARMTPLIHHSYNYGPAIHSCSEIQHLAPALAGEHVVVAGHFVETFERKGHHYAVVDGLISGADRTPLARIRHTTIYNVAKRD